MNVNDYQHRAARTLVASPDFELLSAAEIMLVWNAIGLAGEAGEVADLVKKIVFHRHGLDHATLDKLVNELGDVLWYIAAICTKLGIPLADVMQANIDKLLKRYPDGYSAEASINRARPSGER